MEIIRIAGLLSFTISPIFHGLGYLCYLRNVFIARCWCIIHWGACWAKLRLQSPWNLAGHKSDSARYFSLLLGANYEWCHNAVYGWLDLEKLLCLEAKNLMAYRSCFMYGFDATPTYGIKITSLFVDDRSFLFKHIQDTMPPARDDQLWSKTSESMPRPEKSGEVLAPQFHVVTLIEIADHLSFDEK